MHAIVMQHASLVAFLLGKSEAQSLMVEIADEVASFYADLRETNRAFINISAGPMFVMTRSAARRLLSAVANRQISNEAAVYVADCIVASDDIEFADEVTREAIALIEDDSRRFIEGSVDFWTDEELSEVLGTLN